MCVQVWVACLSADGRLYSGGWLQHVFAPLIAPGVALWLLVFSFLSLYLSLSGAVLLRCDASCFTCAGPSQANCSSCSGGHSLLAGVCVVNTRCTDGESSVARL